MHTKHLPWVVIELLKSLWTVCKNPRFLVEMIRQLEEVHAVVLKEEELLIERLAESQKAKSWNMRSKADAVLI